MISPFLMGIYLILSRHFSQRQNSIFVILCPIKGTAKGNFGLTALFSLCVPVFAAKPRKSLRFSGFSSLLPRFCPFLLLWPVFCPLRRFPCSPGSRTTLCLFSLLWPDFPPCVAFFLAHLTLRLAFARFPSYGLIFRPLRRFPLLSGSPPCFSPVSPPTT